MKMLNGPTNVLNEFRKVSAFLSAAFIDDKVACLARPVGNSCVGEYGSAYFTIFFYLLQQKYVA